LLAGLSAQAQIKRDSVIKTRMILTTKDGQVCPVWKTSKGKYYIYRKNRKTKKLYKSFLKLDQ